MSARVYASTACVKQSATTLEGTLAAFRAAGLDAIELGWAPKPVAMDVSAMLRSVPDTHFLIHNYFPQPSEPFVLNLASQDASILERSLTMAEENLRLSATLGAPYYSVHAGFRAEFGSGSLGKTLERNTIVPRDQALATFTRSIGRLADVARRLDVLLLIEPNVVDSRNLVDGRNELLLLAEAGEIVTFLRALNRPEVGILLDTGHLNVTAATLHFSRDDFVAQVAPWVRGLHVHDNDGTADQHRPPRAGSWVFDLLREPAFDRLPIVLETQFADVAELAGYRRWFLENMTT